MKRNPPENPITIDGYKLDGNAEWEEASIAKAVLESYCNPEDEKELRGFCQTYRVMCLHIMEEVDGHLKTWKKYDGQY